MMDGYDSLAVKIARDVLFCIRTTQDNPEKIKFILPEDIHDYILYEHKIVSVDCLLRIKRNMLLKRTYLIDDAYITGDDNINMKIIINPTEEPDCYQDLYMELIETIRHEIQHVRQYVEPYLPIPHGVKGSYREPKGIKYYLKDDELDAQIAGFNLQAIKTGKPFEELVKKYYKNRLDLLPINEKDITKLINSLLDYAYLNKITINNSSI